MIIETTGYILFQRGVLCDKCTVPVVEVSRSDHWAAGKTAMGKVEELAGLLHGARDEEVEACLGQLDAGEVKSSFFLRC